MKNTPSPTVPASELDAATLVKLWNAYGTDKQVGNLHYHRSVGNRLVSLGLLDTEGFYSGRKVRNV